MKLTEHFSLEEFERSETAKAYGIDNSVPEELIPKIRNLCEQVLEPLRQHVGEPVFISSGYRCPKLNSHPDVGGMSKSQHVSGEAADIKSMDPKILRSWYVFLLDNCPFDQLIWERKGQVRWIHVSCLLDLSKNRQTAFTLTKQ